MLFPLLEQVKYTESLTEKLQRDVCLPIVRTCETVSTRDLSLISSIENRTDNALEPITFNHIGHTASEEEAASNEVIDGEIPNDVFEEKPVRHYAEQAPANEKGNRTTHTPTLETAGTKGSNETEGRIHAAGSFLVIDSP